MGYQVEELDTAPHKVNILMVDDRPENLLALEAVLASPEYNLVSARSGEDALKEVLKRDFAVILLDVQMPGLNGFETAKLIKEREKTNHIPIIFITAISQATEHVLKGYSVGAIDYIFKPFHPDTLKRKIDQFVKIYQSRQQIELQSKLLQKEVEERKKIQEDLYLSQKRFHKIFQSSPCMIAINTFEDERFIDINETWLYYTGYTYKELINQPIEKLCFKLEDENKSAYKIPVRNIKIKYLTKTNQVREGLLSREIIEIKGEKCILSVITDITEKILMEKEMARLDRLKLTGEMAAGIAHEIRNPMTTVSGFLQLYKNKNEGLSSDVIDLMLDELNRANTIITEFLTLAKNKTTDKKLCNLNDIINALFPLIKAETFCTDKYVELDLQDCPLLYLDEKEIRQLILNLVINGLEAMLPGGKLTIRTYCDDRFVVLEVQDQGSGIKDEYLERIGTPFFTTKEYGTGLGLAICYSVAGHHNAKIKIKTGKQGTTFLVCFHSSPCHTYPIKEIK
ncbi:MAG: response regulator [Bacillota bacterium]